MKVLYLVIIVAGLAALSWGLSASYRLSRINQAFAALLVLIGVISTLLGVLLFIIPGFFQG